MKTLELKLKKDVLIVEIDNKCDITINKDGIYFYFLNGLVKCFKGNYNIICKGSELTEEIASELVNSNDEYGVVMYQNYKTKSMSYFDEQITASESFILAVESKGFYWLENPNSKTYFNPEDYIESEFLEFKEAEEKTFRNPLIFVKK